MSVNDLSNLKLKVKLKVILGATITANEPERELHNSLFNIKTVMFSAACHVYLHIQL